MRKTGLAVLGELPWGRHAALFYASKEDVLTTCVPFLKAGLESDEVCAWLVGGPLIERDAGAALRKAVPNLDRYRAEKRIDIVHGKTWYFTGDSPDLQKAADGWEARLADALTRGYAGLRVAACVPELKEHEVNRTHPHP